MDYKLIPYFQPIIETASGRIAGYEVLARRIDESGNLVSAGPLFSDRSIPLKERLRMDRDLRFVAINRFKQFDDDLFLSINISPEWVTGALPEGELPTVQMVQALGINPARILIEITELHGDMEAIERVVGRYRNAGFKIAIDDFGADFSQLDRVLRLRPDIIKLDMRLLQKGISCARFATMIKLLGEMALQLGSRVLVEGVESTRGFYLSLSSHAFYLQGYLFSPAVAAPLPSELMRTKVRNWLRNYRTRVTEMSMDHQHHIEQITFELLNLQQALLTDDTEAAVYRVTPSQDLLRIYICDTDGYQISPNFENSEGDWHTNPESQGSNWSWRPYFLELIGSERGAQKLILSQPYQDIHTGKPAQTAVMYIDDKRILLADIVNVSDEDAALFEHSSRVSRAS